MELVHKRVEGRGRKCDISACMFVHTRTCIYARACVCVLAFLNPYHVTHSPLTSLFWVEVIHTVLSRLHGNKHYRLSLCLELPTSYHFRRVNSKLQSISVEHTSTIRLSMFYTCKNYILFLGAGIWTCSHAVIHCHTLFLSLHAHEL